MMNMIVGTATMTATVCAAKSPALALAEQDPIFVPIQACRTAMKTFDAACAKDPDAYLDDPASALLDSYKEFADTVPTTWEGVLAKLEFAPEVSERALDLFSDGQIFSTIATALKRLARA